MTKIAGNVLFQMRLVLFSLMAIRLVADQDPLEVTRGPFLQSTTTQGTAILWETSVATHFHLEVWSGSEKVLNLESREPSSNHLVEIHSLQSASIYNYNLKIYSSDQSIRLGPFPFKTFAEEGPVSFMVMGDSGTGSDYQWEVADVIRQNPTDFIMHTGDVVYGGFEAFVDERFFQVYGDIIRERPFFITMGNHDLDLGEDPDGSAYRRTFHLPVNPATGTEHFYSFDHGDVHFVCLFNPWFYHYVFEENTEQYKWLVEDLSQTEKPWKVLFFHMPLANSGVHAFSDHDSNLILDQTETMNALLPLVREFGVQLAFAGHDHNWQRYTPIEGLHQVVTGGGGAGLYPRVAWHPHLIKYKGTHHALKVTIDHQTAAFEVIDGSHDVIDRMWVRKDTPEDRMYPSGWHTLHSGFDGFQGVDGNVDGQQFGFPGPGIPGRSGKMSNPGMFHVLNDQNFIYLGFQQVMLRPGDDLYVFVEGGTKAGVTDLKGLGDGISDPEGQGADGFDCLENLQFENFNPQIGFILGDEWADWTDPGFMRRGSDQAMGQGCFKLNQQLDPIHGVAIQQFNESPQWNSVPEESNADYVVIRMPMDLFVGLAPGDEIRVGAVVGTGSGDWSRQVRPLDTSVLGVSFEEDPVGSYRVEPIRIRLSTFLDGDTDIDGLPDLWEVLHGLSLDPFRLDHGKSGDPDGDGATNEEEWRSGTDPLDPESVFKVFIRATTDSTGFLQWYAVPGRVYRLERSLSLDTGFEPVESGDWPVVAHSRTMTRLIDFGGDTGSGTQRQFFRLQIIGSPTE